MFTRRTLQSVAALSIVCFSQAACYNTYMIDKNELKKLESSVEPQEVVVVYADCANTGEKPAAPAKKAQRYNSLNGTMWAQAAAKPADTKSDATSTKAVDKVPDRPGCTKVPVSTANSLSLVTKKDERKRVTPFNFIMSESQIVSPEYDLLEPLNGISGAEVKEISGWKTAAMITGVTLVTVGAFVGISLLAGEDTGFKQ